jgi:hypothetical protein
MAFWYNLWSSGIFIPVLVCCNKKYLASLGRTDAEFRRKKWIFFGDAKKRRRDEKVKSLPDVGRINYKVIAPNRVARWFIFKPKTTIWVIFGGP